MRRRLFVVRWVCAHTKERSPTGGNVIVLLLLLHLIIIIILDLHTRIQTSSEKRPFLAGMCHTTMAWVLLCVYCVDISLFFFLVLGLFFFRHGHKALVSTATLAWLPNCPVCVHRPVIGSHALPPEGNKWNVFLRENWLFLFFFCVWIYATPFLYCHLSIFLLHFAGLDTSGEERNQNAPSLD